MKKLNKILAFFLALAMVVALMPVIDFTAKAIDYDARKAKMDQYAAFLTAYKTSHGGKTPHWNAGLRTDDSSRITAFQLYGANYNGVHYTDSTAVLKAAIDNGDLEFGLTDSECVVQSGHSHLHQFGCDSNAFGGAAQCYGFAKYLCYYLYGNYPRSGMGATGLQSDNFYYYHKNKDTFPTLKVGDFIRYEGSIVHALVVYSVNSDDTVTAIDCNHPASTDGKCQITSTFTKPISAIREDYNNKKAFIARYQGSVTTGTVYHYECGCYDSYAGEYTCTAPNNLAVHSDHSWNDATVIGEIPYGATCTVTKSNGIYAHVSYNGIDGIAAMNYLQKQSGSGTASCGCTETINGLYYCTSSTGLVIHSNHSWDSATAIGEIPGGDVCFVTKKNPTTTYTHILYDGIDGIASWNFLKPVDSWNLSIGTMPAKTVYELGEELDLTGLSLNINYTYTNGGNVVTGTKAVDSDYTSSGFDPSVLGQQTITVTYGGKSASFSVTVKTEYTVSYNANGGSGAPASQTKTHGVTLTLSSTVPTRTGYSFQGWSTSSGASTAAYAAGGSYTANAAVTLYAVWKANTYTVSYNANGGSGAPASQTKTYGVTLTLSSTVPTRTGYSFQGWATSSGATTAAYAAGGSYTANAAVTLYAVWKANTYTVSYNANGGSGAPANQTKTHGVTLTLSSAEPSKTYTITYNALGGTVSPASKTVNAAFNGWNTAANGSGTSYVAGGSYTANAAATLYAQWSDPAAGVLATPNYDGHTFDGWYTAETGGTKVTSVYIVNSDLTVFARWTTNTYTVSYDPNGGAGAPAAQTKTYGVALTLSSAVPTREGYTFQGWATSAAATAAEFAAGGSYTANADVTLYAVWEENEAPVTDPLPDPAAPQIVMESVRAREGETVALTLSIRNNPGVAGLLVSLQYDTTVLTLTGSAKGGVFSSFSAGKNFAWDNYENVTADGVLATFTFEVAEGAAAGDYPVRVVIRDCTDEDYEDVELAVVNGAVTVFDFTYGDANGDETVNMKDVVLLRKYIVNYDFDTGTSTETVDLGADANADGKIDMKDVVLLRKYIVNLDFDTGISTIELGPQN